MLTMDLITVGKLKKGPFYELQEDYIKRIGWSIRLYQIESRYTNPQNRNDDENRKILELVDPSAFTVVMDERGEGLKSIAFADIIQKMQDTGERHFQFIIGGADGVNDSVRDTANFLLSFGQQTWPHMMARVMLLEQIYRAQQILAGHPYHRE